MGDLAAQPPAAAPRPLFARLDWVIVAGLLAVALAFRLRYFAGFALIDDVLFRHFTAQIAANRGPFFDNFTYRFTWWIPTVIAVRLLGMSEVSLVLPILVVALLGIALVYALGLRLLGRPAAVLAALLVVVHPLDVAWSTMLANDIVFSVFAGLVVLLALRALEPVEPWRKRRRWMLAGLCVLLAYHAKASAPALLGVVAVLVGLERRAVDRTVTSFVWAVALGLGSSFLAAYALTGDPLIAITSELKFQGLLGPEAKRFHPLTRDLFWVYPRLLFQANHLGDRIYSFYPQLLVALAVAGLVLRLRTSGVALAWLVIVFLTMQLNIQRADGAWVAGFRNVRHTHCFIYPMALALAGYLVALAARWRTATVALAAILVAYTAAVAASVAYKFHVAAADRRQIGHFLASLPPKTIHTDFMMNIYMAVLQRGDQGWPIKEIPVTNAQGRAGYLRTLHEGYLVTGGARELYYGCHECIVRAEELPPGRWRLLKEFDGPDWYPPWRPEPARVWEAVEGPALAPAPAPTP